MIYSSIDNSQKFIVPDISLHPGGLELTTYAAQKAGLCPGDQVLDIGCGCGSSLAALKEKHGIVPYGLDASESVLSLAGRNHPEFELAHGNARALPYPDDFFDVVLMECVLTLLDDPAAALTEASRVLKKGGRLIISTLAKPEPVPSLQSEPEDISDGTICLNGLVIPHAMLLFAQDLGLSLVLSEDRKKELTDYMIESIMEYGSLEERINAETIMTGASVFDCNISYDPKCITYFLFIFRSGC